MAGARVPDVPPPLSVRFFGGFECDVEGQPLPPMPEKYRKVPPRRPLKESTVAGLPLRTRKDRVALARLVLHGDTPMSRDELADDLWPDSNAASDNLKCSLTNIRTGLGTQGYRLDTRTRGVVRLNLSNAEVDVFAFDLALKQADEASLNRAVEIYRGPLLPEWEEDWVRGERDRRQQAYRQALKQLARHAQARDDSAAAIRHLRLAVAIPPIMEEEWQAVMEAEWQDLMHTYVRSGDLHTGIEVYHEFCRRLRELAPSGRPSEKIVELYEHLRLLAGRRPRVEVPNTSKTGGAGKRAYRVPRPLTRIIGRERDLVEVNSRLWQYRLVTLRGMGGIGKTRLAIAVAEELAWEWSFAALDSVKDLDGVSRAIASALGLHLGGKMTLTEAVRRHLGERTHLLVLDACEHVRAVCKPLVRELLDACPGLRVLTTSRQRLGIPGEVFWDVPPLSVPPPGGPEELGAVSKSAAARLFTERAAANEPDFRLTEDNAAAIARLCRHLDGIPMALVMVAASSSALTPAQMLAQLAGQNDLLVDPDAKPEGRTHSMDATIAWSYGRLSPDQQRLFLSLLVFQSGWTLEAAVAVCGEPRAIARLTELREISLIISEEFEGEKRFGMLGPVRQFAARQITDEAAMNNLRSRHASWCLALAEQARKHLSGRDQHLWLSRLEAEHDNLRAALDWSRSGVLGADVLGAEFGLRLCNSLSLFWIKRGRTAQGLERLIQALGDSPEESAVRGRALYAAACLAWHQGSAEHALKFLDGSLLLFKRLGMDQAPPELLYMEALMRPAAVGGPRRRQLREARHQLSGANARRSKETAQWSEEDEQRGKANAQLLAARHFRLLPRGKKRAVALMHQTIELYRKIGDSERVFKCLNELATWVRSSDAEAAAKLLNQALPLARQSDNGREIGIALWQLGSIALCSDALDEAEALSTQSIRTFGETKELRLLFGPTVTLARVALARDQDEQAEQWFRESLPGSLARYASEGVDDELGWCYEGLAMIAFRRGQTARSARLLGMAWALVLGMAWALGRNGPDDPQPPVGYDSAARGRYSSMHAALRDPFFLNEWCWGRDRPEAQAIAYALK